MSLYISRMMKSANNSTKKDYTKFSEIIKNHQKQADFMPKIRENKNLYEISECLKLSVMLSADILRENTVIYGFDNS